MPAACRRGRLCHLEPGAPGSTGACVWAGAGTCAPWPWGHPQHLPYQAIAGQQGGKTPTRLISPTCQSWSPWLPASPPSPQSPCDLRSPILKCWTTEWHLPAFLSSLAQAPVAGTGRVTRAECVALGCCQPSPGAGVPGSAGCRASAQCQSRVGWREACAKVVGLGDEETAATWPCGWMGAVPGGAGRVGSMGHGAALPGLPPQGSDWSRRFTELH